LINPLGVSSRPEIALLLSCSRAKIDPKHADRIKELCQNNIDWNYLLSLAGRHGLRPLLFHRLNSICSEAVPGPILSSLKNYFNANLGYNRFLTGELLRLLNLFENHGIPAVPFKGPVLASSGYGDLSLREFSDLDILIHKKDFMKVKNLLLSREYISVDRLSPAQDEAFIRSLYDYHFKHKKTGVNIDIHWGFVPKEFSSIVNTDRLWSSIEVVRLGGREIPTLSPEDLLSILCIHGYKHCWEALEWICDIAGLIQTDQKMDWKGVLDKAGRVDSQRAFSLGLYLAKKLLNANLPENIWQKIESDTKVKLLARKVYRHLFQDRDKPLGIFEKSLFHIKSTSYWRDMFRYGFHFLIPPTSGDYKILELPPSLFFLYYLLRPFRLLGKYSVGRLIHQ
jgi:hypothetical protein